MSSKYLICCACLLAFGVVGVWFSNRPPDQTPGVGGAGESRDATPTPEVTTTEPVAAISPADSLVPLSLAPTPESAPAANPPATAGQPPDDADQAREWSRQYSGDALAWLMRAPGGAKRDAVLEVVCAELAEYDPARAVALAERCSAATMLVENLVHRWGEHNADAATAYALNQPPGDHRDRLLSRVAFARAEENPAAAATLVAEKIAPGAIQDEAVISVLHQWSLQDPTSALAWVQTFPGGSLRDRALQELESVVHAPSVGNNRSP